MRIIAFGHRKQVGKDSAAKFLQIILRMQNKNVKKAGFADEIYQVAYRLYKWAGFNTKEYYEAHPKMKEVILSSIGRTPRQILIDIGMHMRVHDPEVWLNAVLRQTDCNFLIMSDLRFPNEKTAIEALGGMCIKIERPTIVDSNDAADYALADCKYWNRVLVNNGSLADLNRQMLDFSEELVRG